MGKFYGKQQHFHLHFFQMLNVHLHLGHLWMQKRLDRSETPLSSKQRFVYNLLIGRSYNYTSRKWDYFKDVWTLDVDSLRWTRLPDLPYPIAESCLLYMGGDLVLIGTCKTYGTLFLYYLTHDIDPHNVLQRPYFIASSWRPIIHSRRIKGQISLCRRPK